MRPARPCACEEDSNNAKETPTFGGYSWPGVGQYEKIVGKAFGELDPNDPKNAVIVDLQLAPRNAEGKVEYSFDFYILKPVDLNKAVTKCCTSRQTAVGKRSARSIVESVATIRVP